MTTGTTRVLIAAAFAVCLCVREQMHWLGYVTSRSDGGAKTLVLGFLARRARPIPVGRRERGEGR